MPTVMSSSYKILVLLIFPILLVTCHPLPEEDTAKQCTLSDENLAKLKAAISSAANAKTSNDDLLSKSALAECPMLANFTEMLKTVATDMEVLKTQGVSNVEVQLLRDSFEEKINELVKNKDIFERQAGQDASKVQGEMVEKINRLQVEMAKLQAEIEQQTKQMYADMAEYIFERLNLDDTTSIKSYTQIMLDGKMHELFMKLKTSRSVLWKMVSYVEKTKNKELGRKVLNMIIDQLYQLKLDKPEEVDIGKNALIVVLCWRYTAETISGTVVEDDKTFDLAKRFFPKDKNCRECWDLESRAKWCSNTYPMLVAKTFG